jgi:hypothetical protein
VKSAVSIKVKSPKRLVLVISVTIEALGESASVKNAEPLYLQEIIVVFAARTALIAFVIGGQLPHQFQNQAKWPLQFQASRFPRIFTRISNVI